MLLRIIYINIGVFLLLHAVVLLGLLLGFNGYVLMHWIEVPSNPYELLLQPWSIITYMWAHYDLWHIFFNMLWLYWMGQLFLDYFTNRQLTALYILGGLGGAALYIVCYNVLPGLLGRNAMMLGASASVLAIVGAVTLYAPNRRIGLLFLGDVSLKWITIITIIIDILSIESGNVGGNIAHIGGFTVGAIFTIGLRRGTDITAWVNSILDWLTGTRGPRRRKGVGAPTAGRAYRGDQQQHANTPHATQQTTQTSGEPTEAELDAVLSKIKQSGYAALSEKDKDILFRASRKR